MSPHSFIVYCQDPLAFKEAIQQKRTEYENLCRQKQIPSPIKMKYENGKRADYRSIKPVGRSLIHVPFY